MPIARRSNRVAAACLLLAAGSAAGVASGSGPASAAPAPSSGCAQVQIVALRGTDEPGPVGTLQALATRITRDTPSTVLTYGLPYTASDDFIPSVDNGVTLLAQRLTKSAKACPSQRFVLLGYSQGAWVTGDALAGGGGGAAPRISAALGRRVAAIVFYGDPRLVAGEPFLAGTHAAGVSGVIPRGKGALATYANRIRSYCDADDTICQSGATGQGHFGYGRASVTKDAAAFVVAQLRHPVRTPAIPVSSAPAGPTVSTAQADAAAAAAAGGTAGPAASSAARVTPTPTPAAAASNQQNRGYPHRTWWRLLIGWNKV